MGVGSEEGIWVARIDGELFINRPVTEVFDFVADERNEPRYNPGIRRAEKLSPGPIGRGTRFLAEAATGRRTSGITIEYTAFERPGRLVLGAAPAWAVPAAGSGDRARRWAGRAGELGRLKRFLEGQGELEAERDVVPGVRR